MVAETDLVNAALRLVGGNSITSLSDGSNGANVASDIYEELRDDLLRSHPWNFATKRVKLAQSSVTPVSEFDYAYPVPSDWLRTVSVHDNDANTGTVYHKIELHENAISVMCSSNEVWLRYVARVVDPNVMASDFRRTLVLSLARDMAIPIASSNSLYTNLANRAERKLAQARSTDGMGGFPERRPRGSWVESRGGWRPRISVEGS